MIKTLKESKAKLSELVERASRGEDVLITVRGQVKARLTRAPASEGAGDTATWAAALERLHEIYGTGRVTLTAEQIVREDRADRFQGDYWDTSALLKLYAPEPDSARFLAHGAEGQRPLLTAVELRCALQRKEHAGDLKAGGATALFERFTHDVAAGRVITVPYGPTVLEGVQQRVVRAYSADPPVMIRSLDAVHITSALASRATWVLATDIRLRDAATLVALRVAP